jgi:hypothetical protein
MPKPPPIALPKQLTPGQIKKAVNYAEKECEKLIDVYHEQANVFSAIVGIMGSKALDAFSPYKKHKHPDTAQQRFPDLSLGGKLDPPPGEALESKGSSRPWAIQSHYDHPGWYIVWRYCVDPTQTMKPGRQVVIWRVDVVFIEKGDWKYEGSKAGDSGGGRTHTFGIRKPATLLKGKHGYILPGIKIQGGKPVLANGGSS